MKTEAYKILSALLLSLMFFSCGKEDELETLENSQEYESKPYMYFEGHGENFTDIYQTDNIIAYLPPAFESTGYEVMIVAENQDTQNNEIEFEFILNIVTDTISFDYIEEGKKYYFDDEDQDDNYYRINNIRLWRFETESENLEHECYRYIKEYVNYETSYITFSEFTEDEISGHFEIEFETPDYCFEYYDLEVDYKITNGEFYINNITNESFSF